MKKRKVIKIKLVTIIVVILLLINTPVLGRYIYTTAKDLYLTSKKFYFTSDLLDTNSPTYSYSNWGGTDPYAINFELHSYKNELLALDYDLNYNVKCTTNKPDKVKCSVGSVNAEDSLDGIIYATTNNSNVIVYVSPYEVLEESEEIVVIITATAIGEYEKTISAKVTLKVTNQNTNISIVDCENSLYAKLELTNVNSTGTDVTLEFDPEVVNLDLNDDIYNNRKSMKTKTINGKQFVYQVVFTMKKETTIGIKFYKVDKTKDYTYPLINDDCIIKVIYDES